MLKVTIWMNMPSFYQDDLFAGLAGKVDLRVIYDQPLTEERRRLGWSEPGNSYNRRFLTPNGKIASALKIARAERDRIHVINGIWAVPSFIAATSALGYAGAMLCIYAECPDNTIRRSPLRRSLRAAAGRWVARYAKGLFAVSHFATDYYADLGFKRDTIYPFGYFRTVSSGAACHSDRPSDLVFVGQLINRKGVDLLMQAMAPLWDKFPRVQLSVVGTGPEQASIAAKAKHHNASDRVKFEGVLPSSQMQERLARACALILPSRWDGWGLVVNEALAAGIPVIVSDRCGAADLIVHGVNGYVFPSENVERLRACLCELLTAEHHSMRAAALKTASALTIPRVSDYLVECLEHMCQLMDKKPTPPWEGALRQLESNSGRDDICNAEQPNAKIALYKSA
jgi:glycosyltransferase involved in cell wall biosynthesis